MTLHVPDSLLIAAEGLAASTRRLTTRGAVDRRQNRLARRHIPWVLQHSPWTARRFREAGLEPWQWRELPPVGKSEMMAHFDELNTVGTRLADVLALAREAESTRNFTAFLPTPTGEVSVGLSTGTSGAQGAFVVSREDRVHWAGAILAALLRPFPWLVLRQPQRVAFFLRADGQLYRTAQSRRVSIEFYDLLRPIPDLASQLTAQHPTLVVGPPSVLRAVLDAGGRARPRLVVSVAEVLEDDVEVALVQGFQADVVQVYQATEGLLGLPCPRGQLHLTEEHVHVELEPVTPGLVQPIITDLRRRAQPMIRHRLNDLLEIAPPCPCGSATHRISRIVGRHDDALRLPGPHGQVTVWPDFLRAAMSRVPGLREYRVVQVASDVLSLAVEPPEVFPDAQARVREELARHGIEPARVIMRESSYEPPEPGVKVRRVSRQVG